MRRRVFTTALLAVAALAACGGGPETRAITAEGVERENPPGAPVANLQPGLAAFGHALFTAAAKPQANTVLSPLSIAYAYGMARAGADEATGAELDRVFGFPPEGPHSAFNTLSRVVTTTDGPPPVPDRGTPRDAQESEAAPPVVSLAGGLFVQDGLSVRQEFLRVLAAKYGAGARQVDFAGDAADAINAWAEQRTAGRIKEVFDRLDPETRLVIVNTLYLKADWAVPFTDPPERDAVFTRGDGTAVRTDLMRQEGEFRYASGPGGQAVELPYAGGELAMWILLPEPGGAPGDRLAPAAVAEVGRELKKTRVKVAMPRWDFSTGLDLEQPLAALGLRGAGYSGIADGLLLGRAVHKANIAVDEWGTEAAAVTGLAFLQSAPPPAEAELRADRPFAFAIVHRPTLVPLFVGQVADPAAAG
ncbi:serpin family protein [Planomonospora venezuelensis]|uniref:Serpin B n=1 Tax=Planomonospora venezuelensis TaxID=1999 RepID=A0A841DDM3_PLAVE|nr:serpin family protein [Planomonospora venezuelensis]MBB5966883.1 serpin B [Planomonospora venezuelensis]GIN02384.1 serpin [Planomonospora venezuelensis]